MDTLALILTGLLSFLLYACFYRWIFHGGRRGPKIWPVLGCLPEILANKYQLYDFITNYSKLYTTFSAPSPIIPMTFTTHPANVEHILKTHFDMYPKVPNFGVCRGEMQHVMLKELLGDGIFNVDGDAWKKQRKTVSFEFASKVIRDYSCDAFRDGGVRLSSILALASQDKQPVDIQNLFLRMTFDTICKVGFGVEVGSLHHTLPKVQFSDNFDSASEIALLRFLDPSWRVKRFLGVGSEATFAQNKKVLDEFANHVIRNRRSQLKAVNPDLETRPDLLSRFIILLNEESQDKELNEEDSTKKLREMILNFIIAGRDTTAVALAWLLYVLCNHPEVEEKIVSELCAFDAQVEKQKGSRGDDPATETSSLEARLRRFANSLTYDALNKMHYLHAAISEALRLYPPVPLASKIGKFDDTLPDGHKLKKGDLITYSLYSMGRLERLWGRDACDFKPERWLKDGIFHQESSFKFLTFNAGPRSCLGKDTAYLQMKMTTAILLKFFRFQLVQGKQVLYRVAVVMHIKDGLVLNVHERKS